MNFGSFTDMFGIIILGALSVGVITISLAIFIKTAKDIYLNRCKPCDDGDDLK